MQPAGQRYRAGSRRSTFPMQQGRLECNSALERISGATLEKPRNDTFEISFAVVKTFVHEDFALLPRTSRSRADSLNEITAVACSVKLNLAFVGLASGVILYFHSSIGSTPQKSLPVEKLREHSGAVHCLQIVLNTEPEASWSLPEGEWAVKSCETADPWLLSGSADRTIRIWSISRKSVNCIRIVAGHGGTVVSLSLCMPYLISSSTDGSLLFWNVDVTVKKKPAFTLAQKMQSGPASTCQSAHIWHLLFGLANRLSN